MILLANFYYNNFQCDVKVLVLGAYPLFRSDLNAKVPISIVLFACLSKSMMVISILGKLLRTGGVPRVRKGSTFASIW